ncbi:TonB-dependent receptor [Marisediminitalea aggregata]|uniref:TonB-dependent receptor n=3 Tax=Marisediminitalea TaxID=2662254 RepID=A0A1M5F5T9_9ALTE|nr:TonB-dependent receptor [Marisediminitalea aggregata]MAP19886.1 TonB-dependent receptor [Alteromonadaceae bacterium]MEC7471516.1 TonB-dependent receptor [Pseudomonadota bacterium]HBY37780.1 TonB-dependent receptor [Alteromonas sp.]MAX44829.1 TonB-dependent receptor [Alteromonadaceae bacterium]MEC7825499.1 TonB-dependent receptor [Pseudomonadota bacterium]|tara:strand:+ start:7101 stop:9800 length:2700 start_codon:yes stop_codon:yes gene_type:complete
MNFAKSFKKAPVSIAVACAMLTPAVLAQSAETNDDMVEVIEVRASSFADSLQKALITKRASAGAVDTILAEDIADFPDQNLAESLQRIPGIAISRDAGQGREITVRGLNSSFTRVQLNGMQAQSLSAGPGGVRKSRAFDFNVFASELFSQLTVHKTSSAEIEEGTLGATVDLTTGRPFDFNDNVTAINVQGTYNDQSEEADPRLSALTSYTNDDRSFGVLVSASFSSQLISNVGSDTGRWEDDGFCTDSSCLGTQDEDLSSYWHPRFPRFADKTHELDRTGITASVQFAPSDDTTVTVDALYSKIEAQRLEPFMQAISLARTNSSGVGQTYLTDYTIDGNDSIIAATAHDVDIRSENFESNWESEFTQFSVDVEHHFNDDLKVNLLVGTSESVLDNRETTIIYEHFSVNDSRRTLDYADSTSAVTYDFTNQMSPTMSYSFDTANPANWELSEYRDRIYDAKSSYDNARADFEYILNDAITLKGGVTYKDYLYSIAGSRADGTFASADAADGTVDNVAFGISNVVTAADGNVVNFGGQSFFMADNAQLPQFLASGGWSYAPRGGDTYAVSEENLSYFLQADFFYPIGDMDLRGNAGVRYATTDVESTGLVNGDPTSVKNDYSDTLPSLNLALDVTEDVVLRASYADVMSRPGLSTLSPGGSVDPFNLTVSYGNPFIDPFRATNYDLSAEYYFDEGALLSLAYFIKDIESFPTSETVTLNWQEVGLPDSVLGGQANIVNNSDFEVRRSINGGGGKLDGYEVQYQQKLDFLPGPQWVQNFGVLANMTFVDADVNLTGQSDRSSNFTVYWEDEVFSARISMANRSEFTTSFNSNPNKQRYVDGTTHIDFSASYNVSENLKISIEGINLTDEPIVAMVSPNIGGRVWNVTQTGRQFFIGASYRM